MPQRAASPTATWCACSTIAAHASPAVAISDRMRPGVVVLPTGAWYDPQDPADPTSLEVHGNPNVLTRDVGTSTLAQGTSAHSCLVEVERFDEPLPPIKTFDPPTIVERHSSPQEKATSRAQ